MSTVVTVREAATLAGVSTRTIRRWVQRGLVTAYRRGGRLDVDRVSLEAFITRPAVAA